MVSDPETSNSHSYPLLPLAHPVSTFTQTRLPRVSTRLLMNLALCGAILYLVMKVQEKDEIIQEKDDIILRLSGNTLAVAAPERTVGRDELSEDDGRSSVPLLPRWFDGVCERNTGGTCFFFGCQSSRNASCVTTWGLRTLPWHSCRCGEHQCAHLDGSCHDTPMPSSVTSWLRAESFSKVLMMIVLVGRSGVDGFIMSVTGLDRLTTAHETIVTDFIKDFSWDGQRQQQKLQWHQAVIISAVKFVFWHLGQIVFFWAAWFAYKDMMSTGQFCFATIVAMKEALYFVNLLLATCYSPGYLLLAPFSEENKTVKLTYLLSPESVVVFSLYARRDGGVLGLFAGISFWSNIIASLSAWIALVIGFFGHGTMFPSLAVGYLLSGLSPIGAIAMGLW